MDSRFRGNDNRGHALIAHIANYAMCAPPADHWRVRSLKSRSVTLWVA